MTKKYKRILTAGSFDILNIGHLKLLKTAKALTDCLIVAVSTDELIQKHKGISPIIPFLERFAIISELRCVDSTVTQTNLVDINQFKELNCDMYVVGDDYQNREDIFGIRWLKANNKILFFPYTQSVSSSVIKERIIKNGDLILKVQKARKQK